MVADFALSCTSVDIDPALTDYLTFLETKVDFDQAYGFEISPAEVNPLLKDHQRAIVQWAVRGGRRAIFASFGLGKSIMQLETLRLTVTRDGGKALIVCPLGVRQEFVRDAAMLGITVRFIRTSTEVNGPGIYLTNYESVRDGKLDPNLFDAASLDEASVLRSFGSKTYQTFLTLFDQVKYRFVATATPSPNRYKELIHYAGFLGVMDTGQALAQPLDAQVLTPAGWVAMGDVQVGTEVIAVDGTPTRVLGVYPQGEKPICKVTFSDGSSTRCTGEHLWSTKTKSDRRYGNPGQLRTTDEIATSIGSEHSIPLVAPVKFPDRPVDIDPWLLGALLGDGTLGASSVGVTSADAWIVDRIGELLPDGLTIKHYGRYAYGIGSETRAGIGRGVRANTLLNSLRAYDLAGKRAWEKRIPADFMFNEPQVRLDVLRGLMDTDGHAPKVCRNSPRFVTTSRGLAEDVQWIVRSLGGQSRITARSTTRRDAYSVTVRLPEGLCPFSLPRKADLWRPSERLKKIVAAVEPDGAGLAQCIAVEHPEHLYVTDDFVVTHNTRFFQRDSTKANNLTLYPHKVQEFWLWLNTWAILLQKPSDLGFDDTGYDLPPLEVVYHEIPVDHSTAGVERDGQARLFKGGDPLGVTGAAREKRDTLGARVAKMAEIVAASPGEHFILWHDLEDERRAIKQVLPEAAEVYGALDLETREQRIIDFSDGKLRLLATKPELSGSGCNFQRHCHRAIFVGVGFSFNDFVQAIHRIQRFQQTHPVRIDIIHAESEREVVRTLQQKWAQHNELTAKMTEVIRAHGLDGAAGVQTLTRSIGVTRTEASGDGWLVANNDCVVETQAMADDSVDLIVTSIPFANHYEYTPSYNDFGHTDDNDHFWAQMDHLTPNLLRVLRPGRIYACHVKDRILFGNVTGAGVPTVSPFHAEAIFHACKDGTKMGAGSPEYILLFHKPQTDRAKGYADVPVVKEKADYTRARWQVDAHAFWRSSGNRSLTPEELAVLPADQMSRLFTEQTLRDVYDYEAHIRTGEELERRGALPATFMSLAPGSHHPEVWHDVNRMVTLNTEQSRRAQAMHVCLARGSLVLTRGGYKPIQEVQVGELVLTHKGRWRPVVAVQNTGVRPVVQVRAQSVPGLTLTPDHKLWTRDVRGRARQADYVRRVEPGWVPAEDTVGSYINRKLPPAEMPGVADPGVWWIVGRWLADGHVESHGGLAISCADREADDLAERLGGFAGSFRRTGPNCQQVLLRDPNRVLRNLTKACGFGAAGKHLPPDAYTLPAEHAKALLDGYLSGDGHLLADRNRWVASSVSRELLLGMAFLAQRAYGAIASVYPGRPARRGQIEGRDVEMRQDWIFGFNLPDPVRRKRPLILDDGAWMKVREAAPAGEVETWNLRVEEDESYTAENCVVKNCPLQFDIVDRLINRYSNPGDLVFDPFGGLFTVPLRALKLGRTGRAVELNEGYFRDGVAYLRAQERELAAPSLFDLLDLDAA
jgi:hypothetical protein